MKKKKKLSLSKETLVKLDDGSLEQAAGGYASGVPPCGHTLLSLCCPSGMTTQ